MHVLLERAPAYLAGLEADRQAALALCREKAEEAKLIKARQEGFQAAIELLGSETSANTAASGSDGASYADCLDHGERASGPEEPRRRRTRRPIAQLIVRELSFSGETMTTSQIAKAIDYLPDRTETALQRLEAAGQVVRNEEGQWGIGMSAIPQMNGRAPGATNGKLPAPK
jgi:DNA-binding transcriptional ArsR family regulator